MASTREIKNRIMATEKTSQITNAMNMVSASKLKRCERILIGYRPMVAKIEEILDSVLLNEEVKHPCLEEREVKKICYVLIGSDRGLAAGYNSNLFKEFEEYLKKVEDLPFVVGTIGFKAYGYAKKKGYEILNNESINIRDNISFIDFEELSRKIVNEFINGNVDKIVVVYNKYINTLTQKAEFKQLLPIQVDDNCSHLDYIFEPNPSEIVNKLVPLYIEHCLYEIILEAKTSEHASRMTAMKNATDNAKDVIGKLKLHYNRARQGAITKELIDIIGGSNAVN